MARVVDPVWIPLSDGCRLAARVWLPDAPDQRCPAILEAIPYRRTDGTLAIDHPRYAWWADRGFAGVRVDLRGSGDSDGLLHDEYLAQEQLDGCEVIAWLAGQDWCNGKVGMIGYSWGGFAGLQVASRRPAQLGAVVTVNSTVRRYTDDCHYIGGSVNAHDMLSWATTMLAFDARPPDPAIVGDRWREMWERRLAVAPPMIERWLSHQLEDDYWRHGSVGFAPETISCPVLAVGGWADPYRDAVLDLLAGLRTPCFGLIGPWAHGYPHDTPPAPNIAFLGECARFFGRYLRDDENGYDDEPALRAYVQDYDPPGPRQERRSGRWVALAQWPPLAQAELALSIGSDGLAEGAVERTGRPRRLAGAQTTGLAAGNWCPYGGPTLPDDQRHDDALSLVYETPPLSDDVVILGSPMLRLRVAADRPRAILAARLCDVAPTGESLLVTRGVLNLTHRHGHDRSVALVADETVDVDLRFASAGHRFAAGDRIRLALSPTYWPWVWPSPEPVTLTVAPDGGLLRLPLVGPHAAWDPGPAEDVEPVAVSWIVQSPFRQVITRDLPDETVELSGQPDFLAGRRRLDELGLEVEDWGENIYRVREGDPLSAQVACRRRAGLGRPGWDVRVEADATMSCTATEFLVDTELRAYADGQSVSTRRFRLTVPRQD